MDIEFERDQENLTARVTGEVNSKTAPDMLERLENEIKEAQTLLIDLSGVEYMSSAGFRNLLKLHRKMKERSGMSLTGVTGEVLSALKVTGLARIFGVE